MVIDGLRAESYSPMTTEQLSGWKRCLGTTDLQGIGSSHVEAEDSLLVANPHNCLVLWSSFGVWWCFFPALVRSSVAKYISKQENSTFPCYSKKWWHLSFFGFFSIAKRFDRFSLNALCLPHPYPKLILSKTLLWLRAAPL